MSRLVFRSLMPLLTATPLAATPADAGRWLADAAIGAQPADSGSYVDRSRVTPSSTDSYDEGREEELWTWLTNRVGADVDGVDGPLAPAA